MSDEWVLRLFGNFELLDGEGKAVTLPNRKVEALIGVLAAHRRYGIERDRAAEILWPGKPLESQRTSLRQALMLLRNVLGPHALDTSRTHCGLGSGFRLISDYDEPKLRKGDAFMPGHEGDWFAELRFGESVAPDGLLNHMLETSRWYARHDPRSMFALFRVNPGITRGIESEDMLDLLQAVSDDAETVGWSAYWSGTVEEDLQVCAQHLRTALRAAKGNEDRELASEACLELGKVYARTGDFERAAKICRIARGVSESSKSQTAAINALRLEGIVLTHCGRPEVGLKLLRKSEALIRNPVVLTVALGTRAFFEVSLGQFEQARTTLESRPREALKVGHAGIDRVDAMTQAMLASAGGRRHAVSRLEQLSDQCRDLKSIQFGVYADELLGKLYILEGDKGLAERRLDAARKARRASQMAVTPLEAQLVSTLH